MLFFVYSWENSINNLLKDIENRADKIEVQINNFEYNEAALESNNLYDFWKSKVVYIDMILNHSETNALTEEILKLTQYTKQKADADGLASVHYIKCLLNRIINQQSINAENIL